MADVSQSAISRIVKRIDPNIRIGHGAKDELRKSVEDYAQRVAELSVSIARHANRNTVLPQDIIMAKEQLMIGVAFHQAQTGQT